MATNTMLPRCMRGQLASSSTQPVAALRSANLARRCFGPSSTKSRRCLQVVNNTPGDAAQRQMLGDNFGARDPFPGEIASNFGEKVLGPANTEHIVKPPDALGNLIGLRTKKCVPCEGGNVQALDDKEIERLRNQVPGWKRETDATGAPCIRHDWKVRNFAAGLELFERIGKVAEEQGHHPDLHLVGYNAVYATLTTHAVGGLTENDFIMAHQINTLEVSDLLPKKKPKYWA